MTIKTGGSAGTVRFKRDGADTTAPQAVRRPVATRCTDPAPRRGRGLGPPTDHRTPPDRTVPVRTGTIDALPHAHRARP